MTTRLDQAVTAGTQPRVDPGQDLLGHAIRTPGTAELFVDECDVVGALLLRRHARLTAELDRALGSQPRDLARAAELGWAAAARATPGISALLDEQRSRPATPALERMLHRADAKEHARLAQVAGLASLAHGAPGTAVEQIGERLVRRARALVERDQVHPAAPARGGGGKERSAPPAGERPARPEDVPAPATGASARFVERIRALLAA